MIWKEEYQSKLMSGEEAVRLVKSGDRIYAGTVSSIACGLLDHLWERRGELENVEIQTGFTFERSEVFENYEDNPFSYRTYFVGTNERKVYKRGLPVEYSSIHLSQIDIWSKYTARPTVCFFEVSPPDEEGYMSLGASGITIGADMKREASLIILEENPNVPYIKGKDTLVHVSEAAAIVRNDRPLFSYETTPPDEVSERIASFILDEVADGSTIQLGLGNISTAIGYSLRQRNDLGIHSELFNEPMMDLIRNGNVTNKHKGYMDGLSVFSFSLGSKALYSFLDHNPEVFGAPFRFVNDPRIIAENKRMVAINNTMAIDLYGQCASDCLAWNQHSATGGQVDFTRGAQDSEGGKAFICTTSSVMKGGKRVSKIMPFFPPGSAVTTARTDVQFVVTEFGCVNLKKLSMKDRVRAMISLAHPDFRDELTEEAKKHGLY